MWTYCELGESFGRLCLLVLMSSLLKNNLGLSSLQGGNGVLPPLPKERWMKFIHCFGSTDAKMLARTIARPRLLYFSSSLFSLFSAYRLIQFRRLLSFLLFRRHARVGNNSGLQAYLIEPFLICAVNSEKFSNVI